MSKFEKGNLVTYPVIIRKTNASPLEYSSRSAIVIFSEEEFSEIISLHDGERKYEENRHLTFLHEGGDALTKKWKPKSVTSC